MATDNVTPIDPHARLPSPQELEARVAAADTAAAYFNAFAGAAERVSGQRDRIFNAMGIIECAAKALPTPQCGEPSIDRALLAAAELLDSVCAELDPSYFEFEEATHG